jgi:hypothetical protein
MKSRSRRLRKKSGGAEAPTPVSVSPAVAETETAVTETAAPNQDASKPWYAAPPPLPPSGPRPGMPVAPPGATEETKEPGLFGKLFSSNKQATGTEEPGFFTKLFSSDSSDSSSMFDKMKGLFNNTSTKGGKRKSKRKSNRKSKK